MTEALPASWCAVPLSDVVEFNPGINREQFRDDDPVPFVPMSAIEAETGRVDTSEQRPFGKVKTGFTAFASGDVLFAKITPCMENGKMAIVPALPSSVGFGSTEFHVLRPTDAVDARLVYYFVSSLSVRHEAERHMSGAVGQKRVPRRYLEAKSLPLPPIDEQRRIVDRIEMLFAQLDRGEDALRLVQKQLAQYRQSVLKAAVTGQLTADWRAKAGEAEWREVDIGSVTEYLTSGSRGWAGYYSPEGDIFIRAQNLKYDRLDLEDVAYVKLPKNSEGTRTKVQRGDMLVTITGANVTKCALVREDIGTAYVSQHVALLRPKDLIEGEFLFLFLVAKAAGRKQLEEFAYGAGKPGLNLQNIREVEIALPSREEQLQIVSLVAEVTQRIDAVEKWCETELARSAALRQSILKDAFSGGLVPQDPSDEPAEALLARIKAAKSSLASPKRRRSA